MRPILHPLYAVDLTPAGENDNNPRPAGGETLHSPFAASARFEHVERGTFRAICTGEFFHIRATGIASLKTERPTPSQVRLPVSQFRTASHYLPAGATPWASSVSSAPLRAFNSVWPLKAARRLIHTILSIAINLRQKSFRGCTQAFQFHSLSAPIRGLAGLLDGHQQSRRKLKCPTKALKGRTR